MDYDACYLLSEPAELESLDDIFKEYEHLTGSPIPSSPGSEQSDVDVFEDLTAGAPCSREIWAIAPQQQRSGAYPACEAIRSARYLSDAPCESLMVCEPVSRSVSGCCSPAPPPLRAVSPALTAAPVPAAAAPRLTLKLRGVCKVRNSGGSAGSGRRANLPRSGTGASAGSSRHAKAAAQAAAAQDGFKPMSGVLHPFAIVKSYGGMTLQELNNKIKSSFTAA